MPRKISFRLPATTANLGSGFDTLGLALSLYNTFEISEVVSEQKYICNIEGEGASELNDPLDNLVIQSYIKTCELWECPVSGFTLSCRNAIPLCRGLGSSSTAVVAGVLLANRLTGKNASEKELLRLMTLIEGHPDNVVPCYTGGMAVSCWNGEELRYVNLPSLPASFQIVAAIPTVRVKTHQARQALPQQVRFGDATFNLARVALLCASWATGHWENLSWGMDDRLHQPYRAQLFPGGEDLLKEIRARKDCFGVAISGSGPTVVAFVQGEARSVADSMENIFSSKGVASKALILSCSTEGAQLFDD